MRKITYLFSMLLLLISGGAWADVITNVAPSMDYVAQMQNGRSVLIKNAAVGKYVYADGTAVKIAETSDSASLGEAYVWTVVTGIDGFYLKSSSATYLQQSESGGIVLVDAQADATLLQLEAKNDGVVNGIWNIKTPDSYLNVNAGEGKVNQWNNATDSNGKWEIYPVNVTMANVTYEVRDGSETGTVLKTATIAWPVGDPYPTADRVGVTACSADSYYTLTGIPADGETVPENTEVMKTVVYTPNFPFTVSTSLENATWYNLTIAAGKLYVADNGDADRITLQTTNTNGVSNYHWCFIGNAYDGFKIYNLHKGADYILSSGTANPASDGNAGGNTYPIMTEESTLADADARYSRWDVTVGKTLDGTVGFYLGQHGVTDARMNNRSNILAYWTGGADNGSTFLVTEASETIDIGTLKSTVNANTTYTIQKDTVLNTGHDVLGLYPYAVVKALADAMEGTDAEALAEAYSDFCASSIYTKDGYYYIQSQAAFDPKPYMYDPDDKGLTFLNSEKRTPKYLWKATFGNGVVRLTSSRGKAPGRGAQGTVYNSVTSAVLCEEITFNKASTLASNTFHFNDFHGTNQSDYTKERTAYNSATNPAFVTTWAGTAVGNDWMFEEADLTGLTVYTVNVVKAPESGVMGSEVPTVTYTGEGYEGYAELEAGGFFVLASATADDFTAKAYKGYTATVTVEGQNINVTYTAILPEDGHVYRLRGAVSGRYAYATGVSGAQLLTTTDPTTVENERAMYVKVTGRKMILGSGGYVEQKRESETDPGVTYTFARHSVKNAVTIKPSSGNYLNDWVRTGKVDQWSAESHETTAWVLEEVRAKDVTISADGVSTLFLDFDAYIPDGVGAKYVQDETTESTDNGMYKLNYAAFEGTLPANNGAVVSGDASTAYTFYESTRGATATSGNQLVGSADGSLPDGVDITKLYALGKANDLVAFYTYKSSNNTLTPNKAYLNTEALNLSDTQVRGFMIGDGVATGIETVKTEAGSGEEVYYDLAGRRVQRPVKGIYITGGKKVFINK